MSDDLKLCYICHWGPWAYFTSLPLSEQWGDDWNDKPHDCNAGTPYEWREVWNKPGCGVDHNGRPPYTVIKIGFEGDFEQPGTRQPGYRPDQWYSVEEINAGHIYWLRYPSYGDIQATVHAGTSYDQFCKFVLECGGMIYLPLTTAPPPP